MYEVLKRFIPEARLFTNERLAPHTTFKVGGPADLYVQPESVEELRLILTHCREQQAGFTLLGHGSNVLIPDEGLRGVVIQLYPHLNHRAVHGIRVTAEAGLSLSVLADTACQEGLAGLAFASGIPGTVGGAVYMNAGAYEHDIAEVCETVDILTPDGDIITVCAKDMRFGYRSSVVQENSGIVLSATFLLKPGNPADIRAETDELNARRRRSQPLEHHSAGSTFKRPPGNFAGRLIQESGLQGYAIGGAEVSEKHAGFIINKGYATADDIKRLIAHVQQTVYECSGVMLEPEIKIL